MMTTPGTHDILYHDIEEEQKKSQSLENETTPGIAQNNQRGY